MHKSWLKVHNTAKDNMMGGHFVDHLSFKDSAKIVSPEECVEEW